MRSFASDNHSGTHPMVMAALTQANDGHAVAYGADPWTARAEEVLRDHFGPDAQPYFVFLGTAANVLSLTACCHSHHSVLPSTHGKISSKDLAPHMAHMGFEHHAQPRVLSLTQATELGTVYTLGELRDLADAAHRHGLYVHMDGARLANACASLGVSLREMTRECGVDVLSLGGTKNGMAFGEAVVFLNPELGEEFRYQRKQLMQLVSKMRYITAQFTALFEGGLWRENAINANAMAALLADEVRGLPGVEVTRPVQANAVFATLPKEAVAPLQAEFPFYVWNPATTEARWMTSFDTTDQDVFDFVTALTKALPAS